jgi:hypothetical protein
MSCSRSTALTTAQLNVTTSRGALAIPQNGSLTIDGRDHKILLTDYVFGADARAMLYTTAEVMTWTTYAWLVRFYLGALFDIEATASMKRITSFYTLAWDRRAKLHWSSPPSQLSPSRRGLGLSTARTPPDFSRSTLHPSDLPSRTSPARTGVTPSYSRWTNRLRLRGTRH